MPLTKEIRQEIQRILEKAKRDQIDQQSAIDIRTFIAITDLDAELLAEQEAAHRLAPPGLLSQRYVFAASLASNFETILCIKPGRGRSGPYFNILNLVFSAVGINLDDVYPYALFGVKSVLPQDNDLRSKLVTCSEKQAFDDDVDGQKTQAEENRVKRRRLNKKGK